jgi:hypothetical protein
MNCCLFLQIFPDWYHFEHKKVAKRSLEPSLENHENLLKESQVRQKRLLLFHLVCKL